VRLVRAEERRGKEAKRLNARATVEGCMADGNGGRETTSYIYIYPSPA